MCVSHTLRADNCFTAMGIHGAVETIIQSHAASSMSLICSNSTLSSPTKMTVTFQTSISTRTTTHTQSFQHCRRDCDSIKRRDMYCIRCCAIFSYIHVSIGQIGLKIETHRTRTITYCLTEPAHCDSIHLNTTWCVYLYGDSNMMMLCNEAPNCARNL